MLLCRVPRELGSERGATKSALAPSRDRAAATCSTNLKENERAHLLQLACAMTEGAEGRDKQGRKRLRHEILIPAASATVR